MSIVEISSLVATLAALATIYFAHRTVAEGRQARSEAASAHHEQITQQERLLEETESAHQREMAERQRALERELWMQRLEQLSKLQDLLWEAADTARQEISQPPPQISGQVGTWTRLTGVLLRVEAALVSLELLGGPPQPEVRQMAERCSRIRTPPELVVSETMTHLRQTLHLSENDPSFRMPE